MCRVVHGPPTPAHERMLDRCVEYLQQSGFSARSLREIAAGVGTSHRMLIYHFGSRDGLLAAVVSRIEAEQRVLLAGLLDLEGDPRRAGRRFWRHLCDPALAPAERLFFEIYAHALRNPDWSARFGDAVITAWEGPLIALFRRQGFSRAQAARRARLSLAATRGLLLDVLLTGDKRAVDRAADLFGELVSVRESG